MWSVLAVSNLSYYVDLADGYLDVAGGDAAAEPEQLAAGSAAD